MSDSIYHRPRDYELEHQGDDRDIRFYSQLVERSSPRRLLELACGSGRLTLPLASLPAMAGKVIVGVELSDEMLTVARRRASESDQAAQLTFEQGDMRTWTAAEPFDLIVIGCSSITHLLTLDDRLAAWRNAAALLADDGRLVVDITMPDIRTYSRSLETPPRAVVEVDLDNEDESSGERLLRSKAVTYDAWRQHAKVTFLYDKFTGGRHRDRFASDFASHVYYPEELRLLFLISGFAVEEAWADYTTRPAHSRARELVLVGRKRPASP